MLDQGKFALETGEIVAGRYEVVKKLQAGSAGVVYACKDREFFNRLIALKVLFPHIASDETACARFQNELCSSYLVTHPNIVRTYEFINTDGIIGYTMEYLEGGDLADQLRQRRGLPVAEIINILIQLCAGIAAMHKAGIIHRDLKPENILFTQDNEVKITDFGIARWSGSPRLTEHGGVVGTIAYLSPEYILDGKVDWRSDLYAIGLLAYEMLTGDSPFKGNSVVETMQARLKSDPVPPGLITFCPPQLERTILKALERNPELRYQSAAELAEDLAPLEERFSTYKVNSAQAAAPKQPEPLVESLPDELIAENSKKSKSNLHVEKIRTCQAANQAQHQWAAYRPAQYRRSVNQGAAPAAEIDQTVLMESPIEFQNENLAVQPTAVDRHQQIEIAELLPGRQSDRKAKSSPNTLFEGKTSIDEFKNLEMAAAGSAVDLWIRIAQIVLTGMVGIGTIFYVIA